jgi:nucleobase:cation symporter-1, NCS1 family
MTKDIVTNETQALIDELAKRNKAPKNVEQFGIEPIPEELKTVKWYDLFAMFAAFIINPVHLVIAGAAVTVTGLSFWGAVWAQIVGIAFSFTFYCLYAMTGVKNGLAGSVSTRFTLGIHLSKYGPSILRAALSVFWFASQTLAGGLAIQALLRELTGTTYNLIVISFIFAVFQTIIAIVGFESLKITTRVVFPLKLLGMGYIMYMIMSSKIPEFQYSYIVSVEAQNPGWGAFALSASIMAGIYFTLFTDAADLTRYSRSKVDVYIGVLGGAIFSVAFISFIGAYSAIAIGNWNIFDAATQLNPATFIIIFLILMVVLDNWTINILNLYTGGLCLVNSFPKLGRFWSTVICGIVATFASCFPVFIDNATPIMNTFGIIYSPLVGVILADYVLLKRMKINVNALYDPHGQYRFNSGINWLAVGCVAIGSFTFGLWPDAMIPNVSNVLFVMVLYWILVKAVSPVWPAIKIASEPYVKSEVESTLDLKSS